MSKDAALLVSQKVNFVDDDDIVHCVLLLGRLEMAPVSGMISGMVGVFALERTFLIVTQREVLL